MLDEVALAIGIEVAKKVYEAKVEGFGKRGSLEQTLADKKIGLFERKRASRQYEQMAEGVSRKILAFLDADGTSVAENEELAAMHAVRDSLEVAEVDLAKIVAVDLDPAAVERLVVEKARSVLAGAALGEPATRLYSLVLREACTYLVDIAESVPTFETQAFKELLTRESAMEDLVREVLARIPLPTSRSQDPDTDFELNYRRALARKYSNLQLFGVTLSDQSRHVDIDVAYLSLMVDLESAERESRFRIDEIQASVPRMLIKGEAGSGKTTVLQWLAVNGARRSFTGPTEVLNDYLPIFVPLRRYANADLPRPDQFLHHTLPAIHGEMPTGWINRRLADAKVLLLLDGIDELPDAQRPAVATWLADLISTYPDNRLVITSRPSAVADDWLSADDFRLAELQPMSVLDIKAFIDHWYSAARNTAHPDEHTTLDGYRDSLKEVITGTTSIRALASNPLLCAMLCALNRDRRTNLPRDRMDLYRIALETFLDRRDAERAIPDGVNHLSLRQKMVILQDLAFWLVLNSQTMTSAENVHHRLGLKLAAMPQVAHTSDQVYRYLLDRSGLLREPTPGQIDFIHRTFQEYLAAQEAVAQNNIPLLIDRGADEMWRETIVLACGHASTDQRESLLNGLLDTAGERSQERHVRSFLAVACVETATELGPDLNARIQEALRELVPPKTATEASDIAQAGELALPALSNYGRVKARESAAVVQALCLIGGPVALRILASYAEDRRVVVQDALIDGLQFMPSSEYVQEILSEVMLTNDRISISRNGSEWHLRPKGGSFGMVYRVDTGALFCIPPGDWQDDRLLFGQP